MSNLVPDPKPPAKDSVWTKKLVGALFSAAGCLVLLIVGLIVHGHFSPYADLCNTGLGALGQSESSSVRVNCGLNTFLTLISQIFEIVGGIGLVLSVLLAGVLFLTKQSKSGAGWQLPRQAKSGHPGKPATGWQRPDSSDSTK